MVFGGIPIRVVLCENNNHKNIFPLYSQSSEQQISAYDNHSRIQTIVEFDPVLHHKNCKNIDAQSSVILNIENLIFEGIYMACYYCSLL